MEVAQTLLDDSVEGRTADRPDKRARYAVLEGEIFKGYPDDQDGNWWHGYPVSADDVRTQVPARVLRHFVRMELLTQAQYKRMLGSAQ